MDVSICSSTARRKRLGGVGHIDIDQSSTAGEIVSCSDGEIATNRSSCNGIAEFFVNNDVVSPTYGQLIEMTSKIVLSENDGTGGVQVKQLLEVEDLDTMRKGLGSYNGIMLECSDFSPPGTDSIKLRETAKIQHLPFATDLNKSGPVILAYCDELSSIIGGPAP